ncbi:MAG TPA: TolC family protein [Acidobacteriota bacterium]|nr:TolC family protein [Acidobacteriota bacterium]
MPLLLAVSFGIQALPSRADESPPAPGAGPGHVWTLERVLDAAREAGPSVRAAKAAGRAGEALGAAQWGALSPKISFRSGLSRSNDPALLFTQRLWQGRFTNDDFALDALNEPGPRTALEYGFVLEQPLWNGGAELTAPAAASRAKREARAASDAAVADALLDAVRRYVGYVSARARADGDSAAAEAAGAAHRAAAERHRRGQVPDLDTLRTFAHAAEARERRLSSIRDRDVALRRLGDAIGAAPRDEEIAAPPPGDPAAFLGAAEPAGEPHELRAARARADRLGLDASRASLRLLPALNGRLAMTYYRDPDVDDVERRWFAGLSLDWPLWDGTVRWQERRAAAAGAEGARAEAEALRRELAAREDAARRDLELAGPRRDAARAARDASEEALRLATARYAAGLLPLDARVRHIEREADVFPPRCRTSISSRFRSAPWPATS